MFDTLPGINRSTTSRAAHADGRLLATASVALLSSCLLLELAMGPGSDGHGFRLGVFSIATVVNLMLEMIRHERRARRERTSAAETIALARAFQSAPGTAVPIEGRVCMSH